MGRHSKPKTPGVKSGGYVTRDVNAALRVSVALEAAIELGAQDWQQIAKRAGYASAGAAFNAVQRELSRVVTPRVETFRAIEARAYDRLWAVYYPKAIDGDGWSFDRCLRLSEQRRALLGLDMPKPKDDAATNGPQTIVQAVPPQWAAAFTTQAPTPVAQAPMADTQAMVASGQGPEGMEP